MFKNDNENDYPDSSGVEDTVIGNSIKIEGDLVSAGSINVEGEVSGSVKTEKTLTVGEKAKISAEVKAREAFVAGKIDGNVTIDGKLEMTSSAQINGDIQASTLSIAPGAIYNGRCTMTEKAPDADNSASTGEDGQDEAAEEVD